MSYQMLVLGRLSIRFICFVFVVVTISGCQSKGENQTIEISNFLVGIGSVDSTEQNAINQKLTYEIQIHNPKGIRIVDNVDVIFSKFIKDRITRIQSESISYNAGTIEITGEVIFDAWGLTKEEIAKYDPFVRGVQFLGDDNNEYFLPLLNAERQLRQAAS